MRWFAIILAFILTVLFVLPCTDGDNRCMDRSSAQTGHLTAHDHGEDQDDGCSPFCQCACCSVTIAVYQFYQPELGIHLQNPIIRELVISDDYFVSNYHGSVWQPPKSIS